MALINLRAISLVEFIGKHLWSKYLNFSLAIALSKPRPLTFSLTHTVLTILFSVAFIEMGYFRRHDTKITVSVGSCSFLPCWNSTYLMTLNFVTDFIRKKWRLSFWAILKSRQALFILYLGWHMNNMPSKALSHWLLFQMPCYTYIMLLKKKLYTSHIRMMFFLRIVL